MAVMNADAVADAEQPPDRGPHLHATSQSRPDPPAHGARAETDKEIKGATPPSVHEGEDEKSHHSLESTTEATHHDDAHHPASQGMLVGGGDDDDPGLREAGLAPALSRASSTRSRPVIVVPVSERRGLFARLAFVVPEVQNPYHYSRKSKWTITVIVAVAGSVGPIGSSILYPALSEMAVDLKTTPTIANLTVAIYMLGLGIFPLWWSSFSEEFGRRNIYVTSFSLFVFFSVLCAVSPNIGMLIAMRILAGGSSAAVQAVGSGTIADIWEVKERGHAVGWFYLGPLMGPLLAPIIGGLLSHYLRWRSTMWFLAIFGAVILFMILFGLPETVPRRPKPAESASIALSDISSSTPGSRGDAAEQPPSGSGPPLARVPTRQSVKVHTKKAVRLLKRFFVDPLKILLYLRFPAIAVTVSYAAITFGAVFVMNISTTTMYTRPPYSFNELVIGLLYIPVSSGYALQSAFGGKWSDRIMAREARKAGRYDAQGKPLYWPRDRMRENAYISAVLYPAGQVAFGWTIGNGVHWAAPSVASFFFGLGSMTVFGASTTMLTEFMPHIPSGGIAINNFARNMFSCLGAIVAQPLIDAMGVGWLSTTVAVTALVWGLTCIWSLGHFGRKWQLQLEEARGQNSQGPTQASSAAPAPAAAAAVAAEQ